MTNNINAVRWIKFVKYITYVYISVFEMLGGINWSPLFITYNQFKTIYFYAEVCMNCCLQAYNLKLIRVSNISFLHINIWGIFTKEKCPAIYLHGASSQRVMNRLITKYIKTCAHDISSSLQQLLLLQKLKFNFHSRKSSIPHAKTKL